VTVHEVAAEGFGSEAEVYERSRPTYPADAVAWVVENLRLQSGTNVADVAAGTGKLTRLLEPSGASVIAVEPVGGMLAVLRRISPATPAVAATAEALSFRDGSLDAITVAQAFHWFEALRALREFHRVLRRGGRLALLWNARDRSEDWIDRCWTIIDRVEKRAPWRDHDNWRETAFVQNAWFTALAEAQFHHRQELTHEGVIERILGVSHVAVLPPPEREGVLDEVREVLRTHPDTRGRKTVEIPYRVDAYWCERR